MELKKLTVHNYKSLVNFELNEPNAFTVFAGPNGAGKSNIFEALEFWSYSYFINFLPSIENIFGGKESFLSFKSDSKNYGVELKFSSELEHYRKLGFSISTGNHFNLSSISNGVLNYKQVKTPFGDSIAVNKFYGGFLRLFIGSSRLLRVQFSSNYHIVPDASNLESVLKRILKEEAIKEEFLEWLDLFVPGFSNIEIHSDNIGGTDTLLIYEEGTQKPFTKNLISDGTYNILALLTAVYQTNEPQFLCIEEPENGLNPYVVRKMVDFFRQQCEEKGHVIWLNTHSQTLVSKLKPEELVLVEKKEGETVIKQFPKGYNLHGLDMDEAWLSNALGGGLPW